MWKEKEFGFFFKHLVTCFPSGGGKDVKAGAGQVLVIPGALDVDTVPERHMGTKAQRKYITGKNTGIFFLS